MIELSFRKYLLVTACCWLLLGFNFKLVRHFVSADYFGSLRSDGLLLIFGAHRAFEGHGAVLGNDLHIVGVGRKRLVGNDGFANLLGDVAIRLVHALLVGGDRVGIVIALIHFGVVGLRSRLVIRLRTG